MSSDYLLIINPLGQTALDFRMLSALKLHEVNDSSRNAEELLGLLVMPHASNFKILK